MLMNDFGTKMAGVAGERDSHGGLLGTSTQNIHAMGIAELQAAYGRGTLVPGTVVATYLERIESYNGTLKAFVDIDYDQIARSVMESERRFSEDNQRPLEGVPVAVTAECAVLGLCHHAGLSARDDVIAICDSEVVRRLRSAGAIVLGTLNMDEAGLSHNSANPFTGQPINPHDESSAACGAATAVAAGLCVASVGVDRLGAIRVSAALCGVYGYQPTEDADLTAGIWPAVPTGTSLGVVTRSMEDLSLLANVLFSPDLATAMRRSRFMRLAEDGGVACEMEISLAYAATVGDLREPPAAMVLPHECSVLVKSLAAVNVQTLVEQLVQMGEERCSKLSAQLEARLEPVLARSDEDFASDGVILGESIEAFKEQIGSNGVLILPTAPVVSCPTGPDAPDSLADFAALANMAGVPSVTIPAARVGNSKPVGVMLIGPVGGDAMIIAQARMLNDALRGYAAPANYQSDPKGLALGSNPA